MQGSAIARTPNMNKLLDALRETNEFSAISLDGNRTGYLSPDQQRLLLRRAFAFGLYTVAALAFILVTLVWTLLDHPLPYLISMICFPLGIGIALYCLWRTFQYFQDAVSRELVIVEGTLQGKHFTDGAGVSAYVYRINTLEWEVSEAAYHALEQGYRYRVYYTPRTHTLVNVEPVTAE
jgi:hypothetical protein